MVAVVAQVAAVAEQVAKVLLKQMAGRMVVVVAEVVKEVGKANIAQVV